jgi:choline dehydrogenase
MFLHLELIIFQYINLDLKLQNNMLTGDYIIIGGGTAACVLANRLSKNPANEIILLESGGKPDHAKLTIPASFYQMFKSRYDWNFHTVPQKQVNNRKMYQPRGKMLGGCSQLNAMIYIRGAAKDYDEWAAMGNHLWSYKKVLPYFKKGKNNFSIDSQYHTKGGEQNISNHRVIGHLTNEFIASAQANGFKHNPDFNGKDQVGVGTYQLFQKGGKRESVYDSFLKPIQKRKNLRVITGATVKKIVFEDNKAEFVEYYENGKQKKAKARREVILCAGTFGSPQILMRSGIGDINELKEHGIIPKVDISEVGKNLQDHLAFGINVETASRYSYDGKDKLPKLLKPLLQYLLFKRGPLSSNIAEGGAFFKTDKNLPAADFQILFAPATFIKHGLLDLGNHKGFTMGACHLQPKSRGTVKLKNKSLRAAPLIDPNYMSAEEDREALVKGYKAIQQILYSDPLIKYIKKEKFPSKKLESSDEILDFLRNYIQTLYHPVGTCRMGLDLESVVDQRLKVRGVLGLRVVDASVMPKIIRGNTQAPVMMIAERAAEFILKDRLTLSTRMVY